LCACGLAPPTAFRTGDATTEDAGSTIGQRVVLSSEKVELLPTEPVEIAICVVSGDDDTTWEQRGCLRSET